jgi:cold shock CspA family protein
MVVGTVKSYSGSKGWGFVVHNGQDIFVMQSELNGRIPEVGDKINFTKTQTPKGAQATNIKFMGNSADAKYKGVIKSFVHGKGYGFITSDALPGQDIFFLKTEVSSQAQAHLEPGAWCAFKVSQTEKGPQAANIFLIGWAGNNVQDAGKGSGGFSGGNMGGMPDAGALQLLQALIGGDSMGGGSFGGFGGGVKNVLQSQFQKQGKGGWQSGAGGAQQKAFKVDKSGGELGEFTGTIKSFNDMKYWGFIECPDIAASGYGDVFLHGDMKKSYQQGQTVKFTCVINKDGKPVAIDLKSGLK